MPTIFLSLRGDGAPRVLETFRRALGEEATSLTVVPTNDEGGYHGSAEVADVVAAREAFALARKPYPTLKAFLGEGDGGDRPPNVAFPEGRSRGGERPPGEGRRRPDEGRPRGQERPADKAPVGEDPERSRRRSGSRGRGRGQSRQGAEGASDVS
jgi:hypothetical protein